MTCKESGQMIIPYINDELTDKELEGFLDHVQSCAECYEELEIYYTIYTGLAQLDGGDEIGDMQGLLEDSLHASQKRVRGRHIFRFVFVLSQVAAIISLIALIVTETIKIL